MKNMFDYTFYRTAKRHYKRDGANGFTGVLIISFIIFLYIITIFFSIKNFFNIDMEKSTTIFEKVIVVMVMILIFFLVQKRYKNKYFEFREKWVKETKKQKIIGEVLILIFFFLPLIIGALFQMFMNLSK